MVSRLKKDRLRKGNLFVPLIFSFGAAVEGISLDDFLEEPTKISNTLRLIQSYFQVDGLVCYADKTVLAEALGCLTSKDSYPPGVQPLQDFQENFENRMSHITTTARSATALDVTKRLNILLPDCVLLSIVPGPLTLAGQLTGMPVSDVLGQPELLSLAAKACLTFEKALGDAGTDILLVSESEIPVLNDDTAKLLARTYAPMWNTAKFYDIRPLLMVEKFLPEHVVSLRRVVDGLVFPAVPDAATWAKGKQFSLALPAWLLEKEPDEIHSFMNELNILEALRSSKLFLVITEGEIPANINKESMIRGIQVVRDFLKMTVD